MFAPYSADTFNVRKVPWARDCGNAQARPSALWKEEHLTTTTEYRRARPQPEPLAQPDPVLLHAAGIVRDRGFCQGLWRAGEPPCAAGAVGMAGGDLGLSRAETEAAVLRLARSLGGYAARDVHGWNDASGRNAEDVVDALERAAYGL